MTSKTALQSESRLHDRTWRRIKRVGRGNLAALNAVRADSVAVFCWSDVRPLSGAAGYLDWRACGALSRTMETGAFVGHAGETLLLPIRTRLHIKRVFAFGLGPWSDQPGQVFSSAVVSAYNVLQAAGSPMVVFLAPSACGKERALSGVEEEFVLAVEQHAPGHVDEVLVEVQAAR